ncbi:hypothetical protein BDE36_0201 [Arcticibacter tournemirensis]|uniref:Uncharacterized protein n=1 Tax=Arcticibacter tournemirensis TaxID=699437 RepID=A0A5M9GI45_9SPHI|nr:hypothetical protein [Arcticibacter tournemirensis]KAA8473717.1 hypothetical protein F1649_22620 [Arcticibacter tournemirensis]TQM48517.1 hypothetical protein BDE36_0201 [Arcticibacter tournemirensis]
MKTNLIVLSSDSVDRYGYRIHIKALEMMLRDRMREGIPMLFGHDHHKPIGWGTPFALYLEPHLTRLIAIQATPTTEEESEQVLNNHNIFRSNRYYNSSKKYLETFHEVLNQKGISDFKITNINCLTANREKIASTLFPELFSKDYRDELVPFSILLASFDYLGQGVFKNKTSELTVFAHRYFRRSESVHNTPNSAFLDRFLALKDEQSLDLSIRIDENQIGYAPSFQEYMELEYQWGPKYSDELESIKEGLSRHDCDDFERAYYGFSRSEFLWEWDKKKTKFSFQMEELKDEESPTEQDQYNCRYVHTVYDKVTSCLEHFDGAVRAYDSYEMLERLDKDFKSYGKKSRYTKLFKINGKFPLETWKLLVTLYLRGNPIIYEYFGLKKDLEKLKSPVQRKLSIKESVIPYGIEPGDGIRLLISYIPIPENLKEGRFINSFDIIGDMEKSYRCLDYYILEFKKALMRFDCDLEIPEDVLLIRSPDNYWNIPLIMHNGENSWILLKDTIAAFKLLYSKMIDREYFFKVSMTIGIVIDGKIVQISAYGPVSELYEWLLENLPFPDEEETFADWVSHQRTYLERFAFNPDKPLMAEMIQMDGVLYAKRTLLNSEYEFKENRLHNFEWTINLNKDEQLMFDEPGIEAIPSIHILQSVCADSGENYFTSRRSAWLDNGFEGVNFTKWAPIALHWAETDKIA